MYALSRGMGAHNVTRNGIRRPLMQYMGGKWRIAPWIIEHMPAHRCYVELFGGAASVLLSKPPAPIEVLNDLDDEVNTLYRVLRNTEQLRALMRALKRTPYGRSAYLEAIAPAGDCDQVEIARRLIVRGAMGLRAYSGARCATTFASYPSLLASSWRGHHRILPLIARRLHEVVIEHRSAIDLVKLYDRPDTLYYADPPYLPETRTSETRYSHEMTVVDHEALLKRLCAIDGIALISGYPSELYNDLLAGWMRVTRRARVFGTAGDLNRQEMLWISPRAADVLQQQKPQKNFAKTA